jgi:hypothetical protein
MASKGLNIGDCVLQLTRADGSRIPPSIREHILDFQSAGIRNVYELPPLLRMPSPSSPSTQHQTSPKHVHGSERSESPGLLRIPDEMLIMIIDDLDPADVACLALTCRQLATKVDYTLHDLGVLEKASSNSCMYINSQFGSVVRSQRFLITERLDRDRLQHYASLETRTALACKACVTLHKHHFFSAGERANQPGDRVCLAAQFKSEGSKRSMMSFCEMKEMRKRLILKPLSLDNIYDECILEAPGIRTTFMMSGDHSFMMTNNNLTMTTWQDLVPMAAAHDAFEDILPVALEGFRSNARLGDICAHISLNERRITEAIRKRVIGSGMIVHYKDPERCLRCGTLWTYNCQLHWTPGHLCQNLQLCVKRTIPNIRDAWDKAWLKHFEGGMKLKETVEWCPVFHLA